VSLAYLLKMFHIRFSITMLSCNEFSSSTVIDKLVVGVNKFIVTILKEIPETITIGDFFLET